MKIVNGSFIAFALFAASYAAADINLHAPFADGQVWRATTYDGHSIGDTYGAVDFNRINGLPEEEIFATQGGNATYKYSAGYGNYVEIDDGQVKTRLAHLRTQFFSGTRWVYPGEHIGYCGDTGNAQGVHLHLEVFLNNVRQDMRTIRFDDQPLVYNGNITALRSYTVEGQMVRMINRPEVYYVLAGARWWVPDQLNVDYFGGWGNAYMTREDAILPMPEARPAKNTMYKQLSSSPCFIQDPITYTGRYWIQSEWGVMLHGGWGAVRVVPDRSFSLWDYAGLIY